MLLGGKYLHLDDRRLNTSSDGMVKGRPIYMDLLASLLAATGVHIREVIHSQGAKEETSRGK